MEANHEVRDFARFMRRRLTLPEGLLWRAIKGSKADGLKFRRQHPIGLYILDFYCHEASPCVEVDGASHGVGNRPELDARRDDWLAGKDIRTLRISASLVLDEVDDAVRMIVHVAGAAAGRVQRKPPPALRATSPCGEEFYSSSSNLAVTSCSRAATAASASLPSASMSMQQPGPAASIIRPMIERASTV
jgi:very-short-patch-repair endonuclease